MPQATALTCAIEPAASGATSPQGIPFSLATNSAPVPLSDEPALPTADELSDRAELQPAYSEQITVDVEAEVAAFRDKD